MTQTVTVAQGSLKEVLEKERAALVALYNATGGDNWANKANWCSDRPVSEWYGVIVDEQGRVLTLVLENNNLTGSIPAEFCELSNIQEINLLGNHLSGVIPAGFGNLSKLRVLWLEDNIFQIFLPYSNCRIFRICICICRKEIYLLKLEIYPV